MAAKKEIEGTLVGVLVLTLIVIAAWYLLRNARINFLAPIVNLENFIFSRTSSALAGAQASGNPVASSIAKATQNVLNPIFASVYLNTYQIEQGQPQISPSQPITGVASISFPTLGSLL